MKKTRKAERRIGDRRVLPSHPFFERRSGMDRRVSIVNRRVYKSQ